MADSIREAVIEFDRSGYESESFLRQLRLANEEGRLDERLRAAGYHQPPISFVTRPIQRLRLWLRRLHRAVVLFRRELRSQ